MYRKLFTRMTKKRKFDFECINRSMRIYNKNITCMYRLKKREQKESKSSSSINLIHIFFF